MLWHWILGYKLKKQWHCLWHPQYPWSTREKVFCRWNTVGDYEFLYCQLFPLVESCIGSTRLLDVKSCEFVLCCLWANVKIFVSLSFVLSLSLSLFFSLLHAAFEDGHTPKFATFYSRTIIVSAQTKHLIHLTNAKKSRLSWKKRTRKIL